MKKGIIALAVGLFCAASGYAQVEVAITNYLSGYVMVSGTCTNTGETGLSVSNAYACVPVAEITGATTNSVSSSGASSDIRALMYGLVESVYQAIAAMDSTNQPTGLVIDKGVQVTVGTNTIAEIRHLVKTLQSISGLTFQDE